MILESPGHAAGAFLCRVPATIPGPEGEPNRRNAPFAALGTMSATRKAGRGPLSAREPGGAAHRRSALLSFRHADTLDQNGSKGVRVLKKLVLGLLLVLAAGVAGTLLYADHIAKGVVETGSSRAFGTPVEVGGVRLGLMDASFTMRGYQVANPGEFESPYLFAMGNADLGVGYDGLGRDRIEAQSLDIEGVTLNLEMGPGGTNFGPVLRHIRELSGDAAGGEDAGPKFVIREVEIRGIEVNLTLPGTERAIGVAPIRLENVGGDDGVWMSQLAAIVLGAVLERAAESGQLPSELSGAIGKGLGNLPRALADEAGERLRESVDEQAEGLLDRAAEAIGGDDGDDG